MRTSAIARLVATAALLAAVGSGSMALAAGDGTPSGEVRGTDYVLLVDCTGTMRYQGKADATVTAVERLLDTIQPGDRVTVYGFGEEPFAALPDYPATVGAETPRAGLKRAMRLSFDADRTDITRGLELAWTERERIFPDLREDSGAGTAHVILLTDGKLIPIYDDYSQYDGIYSASRARLLELGDLFGTWGAPVHTITLGAADKVDGDLMAAVSRRSGGRSYHAETSAELRQVFRSLTDAIVVPRAQEQLVAAEAPKHGQEQLAEAMAEPPVGSEGAMSSSDVRVDGAGNEARSRGSRDQRNEHRGSNGVTAASAAFRDSAMGTVHQTIVGILGVVMGFVAIGVQRRQSWTRAFTKPLLKKEVRVKGYLQPVYPAGVVGAKCIIPIENPGLPVIDIGVSTDYPCDAKDTLIQFVGTTDGTAPTVHVLRGSVIVSGEELTTERKLEDGDIIEMEGVKYQYLRGSRR